VLTALGFNQTPLQVHQSVTLYTLAFGLLAVFLGLHITQAEVRKKLTIRR